jgi:hypothetical protein
VVINLQRKASHRLKELDQDPYRTKTLRICNTVSFFLKYDNYLVAGGEDWVKKSMKKTATGSAGLKKQTKIVMSKALEEDPTVFQYDEVSHGTQVAVPVEAEKEIVRVPVVKNLEHGTELVWLCVNYGIYDLKSASYGRRVLDSYSDETLKIVRKSDKENGSVFLPTLRVFGRKLIIV